MKKATTFVMAMMLSAALIGCQNKEPETESVSTEAFTVIEQEIVPETQSETVIETEVQTEPLTETEAVQMNTIIGSVEDINMEQITVLTDNGNEVVLPIKTAELDFRSGFRVGNLVAIEYAGEILAKDNTNDDVIVARVADSADVGPMEAETESESQTETEQETKKETESAADGESEVETEALKETLELRGTIQNVSLGEVTVIAETGEELTFKTVNTPMYFERGMRKGTKVVVFYQGEVAGTDTTNAAVTFIQNDGITDEADLEMMPATEAAATESGEASETEAETQETETEAQTTESETAETETETETQAADTSANGSGTTVAAVEVCYVRAEPSTDAVIVGKLQIGDTVTLNKKVEDGWSEVQYEGKTRYIKSDFLTEDLSSVETE